MKWFLSSFLFLFFLGSCSKKLNYEGNWQSVDYPNTTLSIIHLSENIYLITYHEELSAGTYSHGKYSGILKDGQIEVESRRSKIIYLSEKDEVLFEDKLFKHVILK
ncbi:MAG: hypothetical protein K2Y12_12715 [Chitinophagaceae bacterium]|jgi:hypothetical protein|nr:hypothetical protein [Chitinophagaceae bacterium]